MTKSHVPDANTPARIDALERQLTNEYKKRLKPGRPFGSKDTTPRKRRTQRHNANIEHNAYCRPQNLLTHYYYYYYYYYYLLLLLSFIIIFVILLFIIFINIFVFLVLFYIFSGALFFFCYFFFYFILSYYLFLLLVEHFVCFILS